MKITATVVLTVGVEMAPATPWKTQTPATWIAVRAPCAQTGYANLAKTPRPANRTAAMAIVVTRYAIPNTKITAFVPQTAGAAMAPVA